MNLSKDKILALSRAELKQTRESDDYLYSMKVIRYSVTSQPGQYLAIIGAMTSDGKVKTHEIKIIVKERKISFILLLFIVFFLCGVLGKI